jgi:hypothetical protein
MGRGEGPEGQGGCHRLGGLGGRGRCWARTKGSASLRGLCRRPVAMAEALAAGPGQDGSGGFYDKDAGAAARELMDDLRRGAGRAAP